MFGSIGERFNFTNLPFLKSDYIARIDEEMLAIL